MAGDFDGDGRQDNLAGLNSAGQIWMTTNRSTWVSVPGTLKRLVAADLNGDGQSDLAGLDGAGNVWYSTNLTTWTNIPGQLAELTPGHF